MLYDTQAPSVRLLFVAVGIALLLAAAVAAAESRIATRYRRSEDTGVTPLAPKVVMARTAGLYHGPVTVTVLIPAHDEGDRIGATLTSLLESDDAPDRIVVVADNCTDDTVEVAERAGAEVRPSVDNTHKKAGALNQALAALLPDLGENDCVMVMDADTVLDPGYLTEVRRRMTADRALMAVGGLFYGEEGAGSPRPDAAQRVHALQPRHPASSRPALRAHRHRVGLPLRRPARGGAAAWACPPGTPGDVYDTAALTEDNELTLALKSLGALMISPPQCAVVTEVMPSWRTLWAQRLRWQRGALENLGAYGVTPQTLRYWAQQLGIGYGVIALGAYAVLIVLMAVSLDQVIVFPFWVGVGVVFVLERVVTAWSGGWRARLLAATLLPELVYAAVLNAVWVRGVADILIGRQAQWTHVVRASDGRAVADEGRTPMTAGGSRPGCCSRSPSWAPSGSRCSRCSSRSTP